MKKKREEMEGFKYGPIEVARVGKVISMKNTGTNLEYEQYLKALAITFEDNSIEMNNLVKEIKELVSNCNPIEILKYGFDNFINSTGGVSSEVQLTRDEIFVGRELEYIQSVLVSTKNNYSNFNSTEDSLECFKVISTKINRLYSLSSQYFNFRMAKLKSDNNIELDLEQEQFLMEAQLAMLVKGDRYTVYEIPHISELLKPHNDEFVKLYDITADDFIKGLLSIQKSLLSVDAAMGAQLGLDYSFISKIRELYDSYIKFQEQKFEKDSTKSMEEMILEFKKENPVDFNLSQINKYDRFDLKKITNWPVELLKDLSFSLNENNFFYNNEYAGYPLIELPVYEKPFISIEDNFYCFDYYNLFDNIYRVVQKALIKRDSSYGDIWQSKQMEVTEEMVSKLFSKLLPGSQIYKSNYYPRNKSLKQLIENDLLVIYDDNLIIVEVKAGAYTYRAPILDIESHIKSLKKLVEEASNQGERTLNYLKSGDKVKLYNRDKSEKCEISLGDFNEVSLMSITLDNFNELASKIEKLKFLNINKDAIAISIDDFRVYSEYFDSPIEFLHYLKHRKVSTQSKTLHLNDELDHLGLYIEHNWYYKAFENNSNNIVVPYGYREKLDVYFSSLVNKGFELEKPRQIIPPELLKIIKFLDKSNIKEKVRLGMFLLDFSFEGRKKLNNAIETVLTRQQDLKRMMQITLADETPICIFCHQLGIKSTSKKEARDYTFATMLHIEDKYRIELHLFYDKCNDIENIEFEFYSVGDIPEERIEDLRNMANEFSDLRIMKYKKENGTNKIGRNELCPCGTGKKYKNCHGKN